MSISASSAGYDEDHVFISTAAAGPRDWRLAVAMMTISAVMFVACVPYVNVHLPTVPSFVAVYNSVLMLNDFATSIILFGQFSIVRSRAVLLLAGGYLFTSLITAVQGLTYPGVFTAAGLFGAGPQTAAWLYMFWHGGFPLAVILYALSRGRGGEMKTPPRAAVTYAVAAALGAVLASWFLSTWGTEQARVLPPIMNGSVFLQWERLSTLADLILALGALIVLWRRPRHTVLDLWLMVVMSAWFCDVVLSAFLTAGRYDFGYYAGRFYGLLAASFVFAMLLAANVRLYGRLAVVTSRLKERTAELMRSNETLHSEIADRKRAEDALRRSEAHLAEAQRLSQIGSFAWDVCSGKILWSDETFRIYRYDKAAFATLDMVLQRIHPDDVALVQRIIERASSGEKDYDYEHRLLMPDGSVKHVHVVGHAARDESGSTKLVGAVMDVTAAKRAEQELHKAQTELAHAARVSALGELAASIAHEVNQPLAAVVVNAAACLRWLDRRTPDLDEARRAIEWIIKDGNRAAEVIRRVRALATKADTQKAALDINGAINDVIVLVQRELVSHGVSLRTELAPALPLVLADRVELQQVIINLMMNGIEAMQPVTDRPRELVIRSQQDAARQVLVTVADRGVGIPSENADRLFDTFYTSKSNGMGIGLSICRSIIEAHGGRISAANNAGPGATFQFTLPGQQENTP